MARRETWSVRELVVVNPSGSAQRKITFTEASQILSSLTNTTKIVGFGVTTVNDTTGTIQLTINGALTTDVVLATLQGATTAEAYILRANVSAANTVTVELSEAGGANTRVAVMVIRP